MITKIAVKNFKSIIHKEELNLETKKSTNKNITLINEKILPVISIYGPNGGGKTTIIEAIGILANIIMGAAPYNDLLFDSIKAYKNRLHLEEPIEWWITVVTESQKEYSYFLEVNDKFLNEKLTVKKFNSNEKEKIIIDKNGTNVEIHSTITNGKINTDKINAPLVNLLSSLYINEYISEFMNEIGKIVIFKSNEISPVYNNILGFTGFTFNVDVLEQYKDKFIQIFKELDINILDIKVEKLEINNGRNVLLGKRGQFNSTYYINFFEESAGTKKIIQLLSMFITGIHNGNIFIIDELDSQLHTKLLEYVIKMFSNKNNKSSQLIFSSHDMNTMSPRCFRKDQIYFAALNESYFTNIVRLHDFGDAVREKSSFSKQYLEGKLGYDPYIEFGLKWMEGK